MSACLVTHDAHMSESCRFANHAQLYILCVVGQLDAYDWYVALSQCLFQDSNISGTTACHIVNTWDTLGSDFYIMCKWLHLCMCVCMCVHIFVYIRKMSCASYGTIQTLWP